ncbi:MAG: TlpA family protein disulfide reductase [Saprospiraceae bacterium]|nr:TlpA family protein disulfide reductase [Saprospiraceae bacterium]
MRLFNALVILFLSFQLVFAQRESHIKVYDEFDAFAREILNAPSDSLTVINFWATWCKPCVKELPYFQKLHLSHPEIRVIMVSLDKKSDADGRLTDFLVKHGYTFSTLLLADSRATEWIDKVNPEWSGAIPATLVKRRDGFDFYEQDFESYEQLSHTLGL